MESNSHQQSPMSSSFGASSIQRSTDLDNGLLCGHNLPAKLCFSRTTGRRFYGCSKWPNSCGFMVMEEDLINAKPCANCSELQCKLSEKEKIIEELDGKVKLLEEKKGKSKKKNLDLEQKNAACVAELSYVRFQLELASKKNYQDSVVVVVICSIVAGICMAFIGRFVM